MAIDAPFDDLIEAGVVDEQHRIIPSITNPDELLKAKAKGLCGAEVLWTGPRAGTSFSVWKSNVQKAIRRCDVEQGVASIVAIAPCGGPWLSNLINRITKVIVSEDIGIADARCPGLCVQLLDIYESYQCGGEITFEELADNIVYVVERMCGMNKNRAVMKYRHYSKVPVTDWSSCLIEFRNALVKKDVEGACKNIRAIENTKLTMTELLRMNNIDTLQEDKELFNRKRKGVNGLWVVMIGLGIRKKIIKALFTIYTKHSGHENYMAIYHAILEICWGDRRERGVVTKRCYNWETAQELTDIHPFSCSYDKHTSVRFGVRASKDFFRKYGGRVNNEIDF